MRTVLGLHRNHRPPRWLGTSGVFVLAALAWLVLGTAIEFWSFPIGSYDLTFEEEVRPVFKDGYWLQALGALFATGLTLLRYQGRARRGSNPRPSA